MSDTLRYGLCQVCGAPMTVKQSRGYAALVCSRLDAHDTGHIDKDERW